MFEIAWEVKKLELMNEHGRGLMVEFSCLEGKLLHTNYNMVCDNFAKQLSSFKQRLLKSIKQVVKYSALLQHTSW